MSAAFITLLRIDASNLGTSRHTIQCDRHVVDFLSVASGSPLAPIAASAHLPASGRWIPISPISNCARSSRGRRAPQSGCGIDRGGAV